jgi:hypothetical protein
VERWRTEDDGLLIDCRLSHGHVFDRFLGTSFQGADSQTTFGGLDVMVRRCSREFIGINRCFQADFTGMNEDQRLAHVKEQSAMKYHPVKYAEECNVTV